MCSTIQPVSFQSNVSQLQHSSQLLRQLQLQNVSLESGKLKILSQLTHIPSLLYSGSCTRVKCRHRRGKGGIGRHTRTPGPEMKVNRMLSESWSKHPVPPPLCLHLDFDSRSKFFHAEGHQGWCSERHDRPESPVGLLYVPHSRTRRNKEAVASHQCMRQQADDRNTTPCQSRSEGRSQSHNVNLSNITFDSDFRFLRYFWYSDILFSFSGLQPPNVYVFSFSFPSAEFQSPSDGGGTNSHDPASPDRPFVGNNV